MQATDRTPNPDQSAVISDLDNNIILFASAGTGKTFSVANRIKNIISSGRANPEDLLCLTFTNRACEEMFDDIAHYVGVSARQICIKTIHGFCLSIIKEESKLKNTSYVDVDICDDSDEVDVLREIIVKNGYDWIAEYIRASGDYNSILTSVIGGEEFFPTVIKENPDHLRNIVSTIKQKRYEMGIYTDDELSDYSSVIDQLNNETVTISRMEKGSLLTSILMYPKYGTLTHDRVFEEFFKILGARVIHEYSDYLRQSNRIDFDDIIIETARLFEDEEAVFRWRSFYKYITIDEMQDTSTIEYGLLKKLFFGNKVMLCGDFFQTIYEWRGSNPEVVLQDYITCFDAKTYMFTENYRSTKLLANASFDFLKAFFPNLIGKYCPADIEVHSPDIGSKIGVEICKGFGNDSKYLEARCVFTYIMNHLPDNPTEMCVMARTNYYLSVMADYFAFFNSKLPLEERIRFFSIDKSKALFKRAVVKDLFAFLHLLINDTDNVSFNRIANKFISGVGAKTTAKLRDYHSIGVSLSSFLNQDSYTYGDNYHTLIDAYEHDSIVVYDTETTGLDLKKDQIIQLAAIRIDRTGNTIDVFNEVLIPTVEIGKAARGIIPFDVDEAIRTKGVNADIALRKFADFAKGSVLVGHNSSRFDSPLLKRELSDYSIPDLDIKGEFDTLLLAKQYFSKFKNYKLDTLCTAFGYKNEDAHNALGDVTVTAQVLCHILDKCIIPTRQERQAVVCKYRDLFSKFYSYKCSLDSMLQNGDLAGVVNSIISTCKLVEREKSSRAKSNTENESAENQKPLAIEEVAAMIVGAKYKDARTFLQAFLINTELSGSQINYLIKDLNQIPLITVHQSKGCEFETVLLVGADSNSFKETKDNDEEARVFYVAISRAKKILKIHAAIKLAVDKETGVYQTNYPSKYLETIPNKYLDVMLHYCKIDRNNKVSFCECKLDRVRHVIHDI